MTRTTRNRWPGRTRASGVPSVSASEPSARDRVAVRVHRRMAEVGVDPVDQPLGGGVLHVLGFLVHLVPGHLQRLGQEQLEQAVPADDLQRQPLAGLGQAGSLVGGIRRQARLGEGLEHAGDRARRDGQRLRQLAGADGAAGIAAGGDQRDRLDVILDRQTGHDFIRARDPAR